MLSILKYRRLIWRRALADVRYRYAGTSAGIFWNLLQPLSFITIYAVVFSGLMGARLPQLPGRFGYTIYLCSGMIPWIALSDCIMRGCTAFLTNAQYLKKLDIPESVFVAETSVSAGITLLISFVLLTVVAVSFGYFPTLYWLLLPIPLAALVIVGFSIGLICGTLNVFFRDLGQIVPIGLQIIMWSVPIVYVPTILPAWVQSMLPWHPLTPAIQAVRDLFVFGQMPGVELWIAMIAWPTAGIVVAFTLLRKLQDEVRDLI